MMLAYLVLLALTAAVLLGVVWWQQRRSATPREVEWEDVLTEAETGGYGLITTEELGKRQKDTRSLLLVDTRPEGEYRAGHIKGAVHLPLTPTWWGRWRSKRLLAALLGPDKERLVVFY